MTNVVPYNKNLDPWKIEVEGQALPDGFEMSVDDGTWFIAVDDKGKPRPRKVCDPIVVIARVRDERESCWGKVVKFKTAEGKVRLWFLKDQTLHDTANAIAKELVNEGFHIESRNTKSYYDLKNLLNDMDVDVHVYAKQSGWTLNPQDQEVFVMPSGEVIGGKGVMMRPDCVQKLCDPKGTLQQWQDNVGKYAVGNTRMILGMCVPFAATMLHDVGQQPGGIHYVGISQGGKTTILKSAASVQGKPIQVPEGVAGSWSNTANAMEGVTARANDCGLFLDEMSQCAPLDCAKIIYAIGNGAGKGRMRADSTMRDVYKWRTMVLSTGEETAETRMAQAGKKVNAGVDVRLANVPSDAGKGFGAFDTLHGYESVNDFGNMLATNAKKYYGHPLRAFVKAYCEMRNNDKDEFIGIIQRNIKQWVADHVPADASHQVRSVAHRFALCAIAGELAITMGILPWPEGEATRGVVACMMAWIDDRGDLGLAEDAAIIKELRAFLSANMSSGFSRGIHDPDYMRVKLWGIRMPPRDGQGEDFLIFKDLFKQVLPDRNERIALKVLDKAGLLVRERPNYLTWRKMDNGTNYQFYRISTRIFEVE